jgi:Lipocalin-like domain
MGDEAKSLMGVWILRAAYTERVDTKERTFRFGESPRGVLIFDEGGRMAAIITPSLRPEDSPPSRPQPIAYSGRYRIEPGGRFVTDVDIAWFPAWVGTPRGRNFTLKDGELHVVTDPEPVESFDGALGVGILTWAREDGPALTEAGA